MLTQSICSPGQITTDAIDAMHAIDPNHVESDMSFLADDLLQGRAPGTPGFAIAARYIETQFRSIGLTPGVDQLHFAQPVQLKNGKVILNQSAMTLIGKKKDEGNLQYDVDFVLVPDLVNPVTEVVGSLIFVGYGIHAPELGYDDYKKLDVKGKIVVYCNQAPDVFPSNARAYYSSASVKNEEAVKRGAIAVISMQMPGDQRTSWEALVRRSKQGSTRWVNGAGEVQGTFDQLKAIATFNPNSVDKLFANSGRKPAEIFNSLKSSKSLSFPLNIEAKIKVRTTTSEIASSNIVGMIQGSDPVLKDEFVIYVAHVDHFGIGVPVNGDSIYNGAHDNASGTAILLEIARTYQRLKLKPKRSVLFTVVTGEESGLLGSDYFASNPTVRREDLVANFSIDMPFFFHPVLDIVPYGAQHSSLSIPLGIAAAYLQLGLAPDPFPEQVVFIRSDHYSFIKKGIPALFIKSGFKTDSADNEDRGVTDVAWRKTTYHTPQDDMSQAFDFDGAATHVKINFLTGYLVANDVARPKWNNGDFFGQKFERAAAVKR